MRTLSRKWLHSSPIALVLMSQNSLVCDHFCADAFTPFKVYGHDQAKPVSSSDTTFGRRIIMNSSKLKRNIVPESDEIDLNPGEDGIGATTLCTTIFVCKEFLWSHCSPVYLSFSHPNGRGICCIMGARRRQIHLGTFPAERRHQPSTPCRMCGYTRFRLVT